MILQVLFYAELETFVLKCKFNSKSLDPSLKIFGCATERQAYQRRGPHSLFQLGPIASLLLLRGPINI